MHWVASLLKRWLLGTHQGAVADQHLDAYLDVLLRWPGAPATSVGAPDRQWRTGPLDVTVTPRTYPPLRGVLGTTHRVSPRRARGLDRCRRPLRRASTGRRVPPGADRWRGTIGRNGPHAGRLALYLTWAATGGVDPCSPTITQLSSLARWLEHTPSRKHRRGPGRRRAADPKLLSLGPSRPAATVDGILATVVEFVRFASSRGWCEPRVAEGLGTRVELHFPPARLDRGERDGRSVVRRRRVRRCRVDRPPMTLSGERSAGGPAGQLGGCRRGPAGLPGRGRAPATASARTGSQTRERS